MNFEILLDQIESQIPWWSFGVMANSLCLRLDVIVLYDDQVEDLLDYYFPLWENF